MKTKLKFFLTAACIFSLCASIFAAEGGVAYAAPVTISSNTTIALSSPAINLTALAGSVADQVVVNAGSIAVSMSSTTGGTFVFTSPRAMSLSTSGSGGTLTQTCSSSVETDTITQSSASEVFTLTPTGSACTNTVPGAPTGATATAGNTTATVTFTAPASNGGSTITGYTVISSPSGGTDSNGGTVNGLSHVVTGLTNGQAYTFTVTATNTTGTSAASVASNSVTPSAATATSYTFTGPSSGNAGAASANFTVTPVGGIYTGSITLTPTGSASTGLSATVLTFSASAAPQSFTITPTVAGTVILAPTASPTLGTNPSSLTYTVNAVVPGAPTSASATAGNASATVTFVAPGFNGGSTITGYTVISSPSGGTDSNGGTTSLSHVVTGLTNGQAYTFTVTATNSVGTGAASVASNSVTPATVPGAPTGATATAGNASATVTFVAPGFNGGSTITGYTVISSPSGGTDSNGGTTSLSHVVTGLTNGQAYTFTVTATNSVGTGAASVASNSVTPAASGGPIISAIANSPATTSVTITWTTNTASNSQVSYGTTTGTYTTTTGLQDASPTVTAHSVYITGLTPSTTYYYVVTSSNGTPSTSLENTFMTTSDGSGGGGGGGGGGGIIYEPVVTPTPTPVQSTGPSISVPASTSVRLVNDSGTFYIVEGGQRDGVTDPGILQSYGFTFSDAVPPTAQDLALPVGSNATPNLGALVRTAADPTVYLIGQGTRYGFTSAAVFHGLGFSFSSVLLVTSPELAEDALGPNIDSATSAHTPGVDINASGTVYWIGPDLERHAYPSAAIYRSWHATASYATVVPANQADLALPVGVNVAMRNVNAVQ